MSSTSCARVEASEMSASLRPASAMLTCAPVRPPLNTLWLRSSPSRQVFTRPKGRLPSDANGLESCAQLTAASSESMRSATGSAGLGVKRPHVGAGVVVVSVPPPPSEENSEASARV